MKLKWLILATCIGVLWTKFLLSTGSIVYRNHVEPATQSIAPIAPATPASPMPTPPALKTWRDRVQEVARSGGSQIVFQDMNTPPMYYYPEKDYPLPQEYYNGLAYYVMGTANNYIIYKQGLSAPPLPREWWGTQYEIAPDDIQPAVRSGQAIILTLSRRIGTDEFKVNVGDESNSPSVCYLNEFTCIESTTLSVEEMKQILRSGRPIPPQP